MVSHAVSLRSVQVSPSSSRSSTKLVIQSTTIESGLPSLSVSKYAHGSNMNLSSTSKEPSLSSSVSQRSIVPSSSVSLGFNQISEAGKLLPIESVVEPTELVVSWANWPYALNPQHRTCPSSLIAQVEWYPSANDSTFPPISVIMKLSPTSESESPIVFVISLPNCPFPP